MTLPKARILRQGEGPMVQVLAVDPTALPALSRVRVIRREVDQARLEARRILEDAQTKAQQILEEARARGALAFEQERDRARAEARAELSSQWLQLQAREAKSDLAASERILSIARLLAERLLREQLRLAPEMLVPLAREALAQFWHADAIKLFGCKQDVDILTAHLEELGVPPSRLQLLVDDSCASGALRLKTPQGALDADLTVQLDRLVDALRK